MSPILYHYANCTQWLDLQRFSSIPTPDTFYVHVACKNKQLFAQHTFCKEHPKFIWKTLTEKYHNKITSTYYVPGSKWQLPENSEK